MKTLINIDLLVGSKNDYPWRYHVYVPASKMDLVFFSCMPVHLQSDVTVLLKLQTRFSLIHDPIDESLIWRCFVSF